MNDKLYNLLPLVYRELDFNQQQSLRALMAVLETAHDKVDQDLDRMYQNWFIETCESNRIPLIADLVGLPDISSENLLEIQRRYVANFLAYKRRSGTLATLNNSVHDASGYACYSANSIENMASSWTVKDPELSSKTYRVKASTVMAVNSPFASAAKLANFNTNTTALNGAESGQITPQVISLYLWRLSAVNMTYAQLTPEKAQSDVFFLHPNKKPIALCHQPYNLPSVNDIPRQQHYPFILTRENINNNRVTPIEGSSNVNFFTYHPVHKNYTAIADEQILIANLSTTEDISAAKKQAKNITKGNQNYKIIFDPNLAKVVIVEQKAGKPKIVCSYSYLSNTIFGAAPRYRQVNETINPNKRLIDLYPEKNDLANVISKAMAQAKARDKNQQTKAVIVSLACNAVYQGGGCKEGESKVGDTILTVDLQGENINLVAEDYISPTIVANIIITNSENSPATLTLNGLALFGKLTIANNVDLKLINTSLISTEVELKSPDDNNTHHIPTVTITNTLLVANTLAKVNYVVNNSAIVLSKNNGGGLSSIEVQVDKFQCINSTILGNITAEKPLTITNSIIYGTFTTKDPSNACFSFSYFSQLKPFKGGVIDNVITNNTNSDIASSNLDNGNSNATVQFHSHDHQTSNFLMLAYGTSEKILTGASNGEEMGVFNTMRFRQKEKNIKQQFTTFLPLGMQVQTYYVD